MYAGAPINDIPFDCGGIGSGIGGCGGCGGCGGWGGLLIVHELEHESVLTEFPSSQASFPALIPSPHLVKHNGPEG